MAYSIRPMKSTLLLTLLFLGAISMRAADNLPLDPNLEPLRRFMGSWRGEFKNSTPEKPIIDTQFWERALNGKAIRVQHSINDGAYGGETFVTWDAEKKSVIYHYFSTAGFMTVGTMKIDGNKVISRESVKGAAGGTTEVESTFKLVDEKTLRTKATYLKDGKEEGGREVTYKRTEGVRPVFK